MSSFKKYLAEFMGTAALVVFGCGAAATLGCNQAGSYLITALSFGLVLIAMAYAIGDISGCHINPAVSLAMFINGRMNTKDFVGYIVSQFLGGIAGAAALVLMLGGNKTGLGANHLFVNATLHSLLLEAGMTFTFVLAVLGVTSKSENKSSAGIVIGFTLILVHLFGIQFTGTSVNPARSFGPAIFAGGDYLANVWVFIVGPLVGAALAAFVFKFLSSKK